MALESWDEFDEDIDIRPLGFSPEGDWILNSRFQFDQSLMRNPFLYELSNQVGRWAVKTQFIEIFHDATGGNIDANDYFGVYTFMEKIEPDNGRLDIPDVEPWDNTEPEITGGYVFKRDRQGVGEQTINAAGSGGTVPLTSPDEISTPQRAYLEGYLAEMNRALDAADGIDPTTGKHFSEYMDVDAWIDNFWLNILSMDPDWGRLSQYLLQGAQWFGECRFRSGTTTGRWVQTIIAMTTHANGTPVIQPGMPPIIRGSASCSALGATISRPLPHRAPAPM